MPSGGASPSGGALSSGGAEASGGAPTSGGASSGGETSSGGSAPIDCAASDSCVDFTTVQQEIDGFGAASVGNGLLSTAVLDASFSNDTNQQMGLSVLRVEIVVGGESDWETEKSNATNAKARGVQTVMATPWSPPASMKTNGSTVSGELRTDAYADYAAYLKSFYDYMDGAVDIISVQNEPNVRVDYISTDWNADQLLNFTRDYAQDIGAPFMMPETFNFDTSYSDPTLNDPTAESHVSYIGLHLYGAQMKTYSLAVEKNKKIWMTEYFYNGEDIGTLMQMAKNIMDCLDHEMNAYVWWFLAVPDCNLVTDSGALQNKAYIMAQFSKFIRPGSHRVGVAFEAQSGVYVQAFDGPKHVIVALNQNNSSKTQTFTISRGTFANAHQYTTSNSKKLSDDGAVDVTNGSFTVTLDAQSLTTFVADGSG